MSQQNVFWDADFNEPYLIVTPDLRITPLRLTDVESWMALFTEPAIAANNIRNPRPFTCDIAEKQVRERIEAAVPVIDSLCASEWPAPGCPFNALRHYPSGQLIGEIHIYISDNPVDMSLFPVSPYPWANQTWDVGYNISFHWSGRGFMKAALGVLVNNYLVPVMRVRQISAGSRADNYASHSVLKSCGFQEIYRYIRTLPQELGGHSFQAVKFNRLGALTPYG